MELDDNTGQMMQAIRDLGLSENTLVVWTTDNGAWIDAWPDAGYTPFRGMKGSSFEGGFRVPAIAWWPGKVKAGTVNTDMWSHMDWWPTFAKLAGLEPPPHQWKDNNGDPIIFDGVDLSESLLGTGPGKRETFVYFNDQSFGGIRVKNYKALFTAKDTWLGQEQALKIPAIYDLWWDPGENYDIVTLFRPGQWLDRPLYQSGDGRVLGRSSRRIRTFPTSRSARAPTRRFHRFTARRCHSGLSL
jgi:arylsulfatase